MNLLETSNNKFKSFKYSIIINFLVIVFCYVFFRLSFEGNDDIAFINISSGVYSDPNPYIVFPNILFGYLLTILYCLSAEINWYMYILLFSIFCAFVAICYCFFQWSFKNNQGKWQGIVFSLILLIFFSYDNYLYFNFTKSAGLISIAGFILIINELSNNKSWLDILIGAILIIIGSFIRFDSMILAGMIPFGICFYNVMNDFSKKEGNNRIWYKYFIIFVPLFLFIFTCHYYNTNFNYEFTRYNNARSSVIDYPIPDYNTYQKEYNALGITENDITMLHTLTFDDPNYFSTEKLEGIANIRDEMFFSINNINNTLSYLCNTIFTSPIAIICILLLLIYILFSTKKNYILVIYIIFMIIFSYYYLIAKGRIVSRVEYIIWLGVLYGAFYLLSQSKFSILIYNKRVAIFIFFFSSLCIGSKYIDHLKCNYIESNELSLSDKFSMDKESLYLIDTVVYGSITPNQLTRPFDKPKVGYLSNLYTLGGWITRHPVKNVILNNYNIKNPMIDSVNRDDIYIVDNGNMESKLVFLQQHYDPTIYYNVVKKFDSCVLIQFRNKPIEFDSSNAIDSENIIVDEFEIDYKNDVLVKGHAHIFNSDPFKQKILYSIFDEDGNEVYKSIATSFSQPVNEENKDSEFDGFQFSISKDKFDSGNYTLKLYLLYDDIFYNLIESELSI